MYTKPMVQRFGSFRDLTQAGCRGVSDGAVFGNATADGTTPDFIVGSDGVTTTRYCFSGAPSGM